MTENVVYKINEKSEFKNEKIDINDNNFILNSIYNFHFEPSLNDTDVYNLLSTQLEILYSEHYTVKMLQHILNYYEIQTKKGLKKDEIIQLIVLFETEPLNRDIFYKRIKLWNYIDELKNDKYFKKYISF